MSSFKSNLYNRLLCHWRHHLEATFALCRLKLKKINDVSQRIPVHIVTIPFKGRPCISLCGILWASPCSGYSLCDFIDLKHLHHPFWFICLWLTFLHFVTLRVWKLLWINVSFSDDLWLRAWYILHTWYAFLFVLNTFYLKKSLTFTHLYL